MFRLTLPVIMCVCVVAWCLPAVATANTYTFHPSDNDLSDLDHHYYYTWGISWTVPAGETITGATLSIDNLNDWQVESGDIMYLHLLDNPSLGVHSWYDNEGGGDAFLGQGILLTTYTDDDPWPNPPENWSYTLTSPDQLNVLRSYAASNNRFGFGFDPDCHYYNCGIKFTIQTGAIPEPAPALLMSLAGLLFLRRRA